ncbi:MAG: hypothetical protein GX639_00720 [Fibrobacter sp.]|nr:hypothetical protein [Fibrobacter sp.]
MKRIMIIIVSFVATLAAETVQNANWRYPYYLMARDALAAEKSSVSDMFHDGISGVSLFDKSLWPDSVKMSHNHWYFEPQFSSGGNYNDPVLGNEAPLEIGFLNSIVYHNVLVRQTLHVDKTYDYDQFYPAHPDRIVRGRIEEAFIQANWKHGMFRLGRTERNWGPFADRSLFLSSNPYTYDAFEWQLYSRIFEFRHLFTAFPLKHSEWDADGEINRYFTAHVLNIMPAKWLTLGVFESLLFTRHGGFPDFSYVNPFSIYSVINTNMEGDGNLMIGVLWDIKPFTENIAFKGQVVWDDFQVDNEVVTDKEPAHWGMDMGLYWRNPVPLQLENSVKLEYNYRSKWLYTVPDANTRNGERYTYLGKSLGFAENDGFNVNAGYTVIGKNYWAASLHGGYGIKGENSPLSKWNDLQHTPGLPYEDTVTTEIRTATIGLTVNAYFRDYVNIAFTFDNVFTKSEINGVKDSDYEPRINATVTLHYSDLIIKLPD